MKNYKKYLTIILFTMISLNIYGYRAKESSTNRFKIENFKNEIRQTNFKFDEFGKIKEYAILGYYNFVSLKNKGKISAYACLTHIKVYDRHEPLIVIISLNGKIIDYVLPEARKRHLNLNTNKVKQMVIGEGKENVQMDDVAGSTFHIPALNAELKNTLNMFKYRENIIRKEEN